MGGRLVLSMAQDNILHLYCDGGYITYMCLPEFLELYTENNDFLLFVNCTSINLRQVADNKYYVNNKCFS